ncbi:hypothetical protein QZM43_03825 [Burkholderia orbicola]|nr:MULTISPECIES: hypothetical protein [Burkholderia cepacia complex]MDN7470463.1 hypothetical protein [Burkholderia orbicola]MDN7501846.1 hypothetical protein [Burkholderia orbicola]
MRIDEANVFSTNPVNALPQFFADMRSNQYLLRAVGVQMPLAAADSKRH